MQADVNPHIIPPVYPQSRGGFYKKYIKRPMDFILSLLALIILSPLMLIIAILVRIKLGSPVIFRQQRPGLNEKIFTLYKFRTMTDERDENGDLLPDSVRLTKFGRFLRSTSLDELPELWNIVKGDMSIVGPRPLLVQLLAHPERSIKISKEPQKLRPLVEKGVLLQLNASSICDTPHRELRKCTRYLIKSGMAHFIATDSHSLKSRPPKIQEALEIVAKDYGSDTVEYMLENARVLGDGGIVKTQPCVEYKPGIWERLFG